MKKTLLLLVLFYGNVLLCQTLTSGIYSSSDLGYTYSVDTKQEGNIITITEPNRVNKYIKSDGNIYYHSEAKYDQFYIKVVANNKYYTGKKGGTEQLFTLSSENDNSTETLPSGIDNCPLYDKYLKMAQTDDVEVQAWVFCGAAALAKCTYSDAKPYIEQIIKSLKPIMDNPSDCPCTDVNTQIEWQSVPID
ncbi:hypothetical protein [Flavobacterium sp.]|uniref:hypothetical protein n=1 Tax=Flavobacterium sp. TaxID=239 RepID=UPI002FD89556